MQQLHSRNRSIERGCFLVLALSFSMIVGILIVGAVSTAMLQAKTMRANSDSLFAQGLAEGVGELAQKSMLVAVADFEDPPLSGSETIGGETVSWSATQLGASNIRADIDGIQMTGTPYEIIVQADVESGTGNVERVVDLTLTPIFQYMIFYDGDLEILPGPDMILEGRVHANGDLYIGSGATLTVDSDYLRATGEILRERKNDGSVTGGTVNVKYFDASNFVELEPASDSSSAAWTQSALANWGGTVQSGDHSVREVVTPQLQNIEAGGYYENQADLVIRDGQAFSSGGVPLILPAGTIMEKSMYDGRQKTNVTVTEIDMALLNASGAFPANGLLYAYRTDASEAQPNGIRLTNGSTLLSGLTVVSENSVYVHGDYNSVNKQSAAVISDAVQLLSNAWDDSKRAGTLPTATDTEYNFAMITGDVPTPDGGGAYSGGFENLPRLHENWSGKRATIRGAFSRLFESQYATAPWSYGGDVYGAPIRDWRYDPDLIDPNNLPPFTPNAVYVRRLLWDDNQAITFKPADTSLALMPDVATYDPWTYDPTFMSKVISDPNLAVFGGRKVDYSDKVENEAPDTADRATSSAADQLNNQTSDQRQAADATRTAADSALASRDQALNKIAEGDLVAAGFHVAMLNAAAAAAHYSYHRSGDDPAALRSLHEALTAKTVAEDAYRVALEAAFQASFGP